MCPGFPPSASATTWRSTESASCRRAHRLLTLLVVIYSWMTVRHQLKLYMRPAGLGDGHHGHLHVVDLILFSCLGAHADSQLFPDQALGGGRNGTMTRWNTSFTRCGQRLHASRHRARISTIISGDDPSHGPVYSFDFLELLNTFPSRWAAMLIFWLLFPVCI